MTEVYTRAGVEPMADRPGPASFRRQIEAVKDAVRIEDVAADHGEFRLQGAGRLLGRCLSPDHEDKTPSLTIFTDEQRFRCFGIGCGAHGDVLDLVRLAEPGLEVWEAMVSIAQRCGIELPGRSEAWAARQERQAPARDALEEIMARHVQRRLFRIFAPAIERIDNALERQAEKAQVWHELAPIARMIVAQRRSA